jgi:hypothetical protein
MKTVSAKNCFVETSWLRFGHFYKKNSFINGQIKMAIKNVSHIFRSPKACPAFLSFVFLKK